VLKQQMANAILVHDHTLDQVIPLPDQSPQQPDLGRRYPGFRQEVSPQQFGQYARIVLVCLTLRFRDHPDLERSGHMDRTGIWLELIQ